MMMMCLGKRDTEEAAVPCYRLLRGLPPLPSGELLRRWTNDRFMATPHRVINRTGVERYALPFFFDTTYDYRMECLPTCRSADNPPRYPPVTYEEYQIEFQRLNYDHVRERDGVAPETA